MKEYVAYLSREIWAEGKWETWTMDIMADSLMDAIDVLKKEYFEEQGYDDDMECYDGLDLGKAVIYPKLSGLVVDIAEWKKELDEVKKKYDEQEQFEGEYKLYQELKEKFEG